MKTIKNITRIEEKYLITTKKKFELITQLKKKLCIDKYGDQGKYQVKTLYFDTPDCQDYQDKINEKQQRKGIRMRIYNNKDKSVKLELKLKDNSIQNKISLKIKKDDAERLIKKDYECLKSYASEVATQLYEILTNNNYEPKTLILYNRYAFNSLDSKIRITIDSDLSTSNTFFNLWEENIETYPVSGINEHILEIKKINGLPEEIEKIIFPLEIQEKPASKYKRCCKFLSL